MKFLFISNTRRDQRPYLDPATRYRCYNPASDLERMGHVADVVPLAHFNIDQIGRYDALIFHKPSMISVVEGAVALAEKRGIPVIADYDDLIFDDRNALDSSLYLTRRASKKIVLDIFRRNHKALKYFRYVTTSTTALAEQAQISHPKCTVQVVHNGLNKAWVDAAKLRNTVHPIPGSISYFCGTKSHDHDFRIVEDILAEFLKANHLARLHIIGPLEFNKEKFPKNRLDLTAAVPYEDLPRLIMKSWINIAPLEDNVFNRCKSGLKFFEAAAFGIPSIASPIPDMQRFVGSNIELPETPIEWSASIHKLFDNHNRNNAAKQDQNYAMRNCNSASQTKILLDFINQEYKK